MQRWGEVTRSGKKRQVYSAKIGRLFDFVPLLQRLEMPQSALFNARKKWQDQTLSSSGYVKLMEHCVCIITYFTCISVGCCLVFVMLWHCRKQRLVA